jgi:hypothetical protein
MVTQMPQIPLPGGAATPGAGKPQHHHERIAAQRGPAAFRMRRVLKCCLPSQGFDGIATTR